MALGLSLTLSFDPPPAEMFLPNRSSIGQGWPRGCSRDGDTQEERVLGTGHL